MIDLCVHALAKNPRPRGHEIYNFDIPFLGYYYCTLRVYAPCTGVQKTII